MQKCAYVRKQAIVYGAERATFGVFRKVDLGVVVAALICSVVDSLPLAARARRRGAKIGATLKAGVTILF